MRSFLIIVVALSACSSDQLSELTPEITLCVPDGGACGKDLHLGTFRAGARHRTDVEVRNLGSGSLTVEGASVLGSDLVEVVELPQDRIKPDAGAPLVISLVPQLGDNEVQLAVDSDDPKAKRFEARLAFTGVAPDLVLCPVAPVPMDPSCVGDLTIDLGELALSQASDAQVAVHNAGTQDLLLADAVIVDQSSVAGELTVLTSTSAGTVPQGQSSPLVVRYQPVDGLADSIVITLAPQDAGIAPATLTVLGAVADNVAPQALAHEYQSGLVSIASEVGQGVWLDGRDSFDPEGDPLRYAWTVVASPSGAAATPESPTAGLTRIVPDVLGTYIVQLTVTDSWSLVDFADVELVVEPRHRVRIDLGWGTDAGHVDLHLVPAGEALFSARDCSFLRPSVDLGVSGDASDDPTLLADSDAGTGNERIAIRRPADGAYDVWAHYFDSRGGRTADLTVTLTRDDGSSLIGSSAGSLTADCEAWLVGTLSVPALTFVPSAAAHTTQCYGGP